LIDRQQRKEGLQTRVKLYSQLGNLERQKGDKWVGAGRKVGQGIKTKIPLWNAKD
jgi:hypothetical protein